MIHENQIKFLKEAKPQRTWISFSLIFSLSFSSVSPSRRNKSWKLQWNAKSFFIRVSIWFFISDDEDDKKSFSNSEKQSLKRQTAKKTSCKDFFSWSLAAVFVCISERKRGEATESRLYLNCCVEHLKVQIVIKSLLALPRKAQNIFRWASHLSLAPAFTQTTNFLFISRRRSRFSPKHSRSFVFPSPHSHESSVEKELW